MTGKVRLTTQFVITLTLFEAGEALEFGIVDGILAKRPTSDSVIS